jgi:hypothetical protein
MCMVSEGWWVSMSLASSTMEIRWPMAGVGYKTTASSIAAWFSCVFGSTEKMSFPFTAQEAFLSRLWGQSRWGVIIPLGLGAARCL